MPELIKADGSGIEYVPTLEEAATEIGDAGRAFAGAAYRWLDAIRLARLAQDRQADVDQGEGDLEWCNYLIDSFSSTDEGRQGAQVVYDVRKVLNTALWAETVQSTTVEMTSSAGSVVVIKQGKGLE